MIDEPTQTTIVIFALGTFIFAFMWLYYYAKCKKAFKFIRKKHLENEYTEYSLTEKELQL